VVAPVSLQTENVPIASVSAAAACPGVAAPGISHLPFSILHSSASLMIPSFRLLIPTLAALAAITIPLAAAPEPQTSTSTSGLLAQTLQPFVDNHLAAGFVAIVADKNKVLDLEAVGYSSLAKKTPMKSDTLFWIASMSKSMTATAFMMLVDEGKVKVDDPVEKYLPEFKGQMVVDELDPKHVAQPADHPITIKEILSHTSGLTRPDSLTKAQIAALDNNSLEREVADHAAQPLVRQPSSKYEYNNVGIDTAGRIIEVVSGMPYADFMQKRLFDPLGMKDTTFWPTLEQGERLARTAGPNADKTDLVERDIYTSNKAGIDNLATRELGSDKIVPPATPRSAQV
jgi:CubicO group peptidase (beta-lactamase class C family)